MAVTISHSIIIAMLAVSLLLAAVPTKAAPTREARAATPPEIWNLYSGLEASHKYGWTQKNINSVNTTLNLDVERILENVCDLFAYYELAYKVNSTGDLQEILKANVEDAHKWVKYAQNLSEDSDTFSEEVTNLYKWCLAKKVYTQHSVMEGAHISVSDHYTVLSPAPCMWVDENVPEPHGTTIAAAIQHIC